mgnify:FL=1
MATTIAMWTTMAGFTINEQNIYNPKADLHY